MEVIRLHDKWMMRDTEEMEFIPATVPGSVYYDYLNNGKMEDPFYRDNENKALELMKKDFEYKTMFSVPNNIINKQRVILHFDGIDTVGDIWLNSVYLGRTDNMHRIWEYSVKNLLKPEENELRILLHSPVNYIYDLYEKDPTIVGSVDAMKGSPYLRKAHCMYGWDWGPRLPDAGIWRDVKLIGADYARLDNVYVTQHHEDGNVKLAWNAEVEIFEKESQNREFKKASTDMGLEFEKPSPWYLPKQNKRKMLKISNQKTKKYI